MVLCEQVGDWVAGGDDGKGDVKGNLGVLHLVSRNEGQELRHVMSHLRGRGWGS